MKNQIKNLLKSGVLILILLTSLQNQVKAQEKKKETVRIKVICSENGNKTTMDTTITNNTMDISTIIKTLNIPECGDKMDDINIDSIVSETLTSINIDSIIENVKILSEDEEGAKTGKHCKMIKLKLDGDFSNDTSFSFIMNNMDSLIENENVKIIVKNCGDNEASDKKFLKKKVVICKIVLLDTDKEDKQIIRKLVKNIDNNTLEVKKMSFYPNPTSGKFKLDFSLESEQDVKIKILDAAGKEVYIEDLKDFSGWYSKEIDISGNKKGVYFIVINQGDKYKSKKIVLE